MKLLTKRAYALFILLIFFLFGILFFTVEYGKEASAWAQSPSNKHLFTNGQPKTVGSIYDRNGEILMETVDGEMKYNQNETVRKAVMHAVGDSYGNIVTSAQVAMGDQLSGWDFLNGAYRFHDSLSSGSDLTLTLDAQICSEAYKALKGRNGTVGVMNYQTGEILCMVSTPTFDPANHPDVAADPDQYEGVYLNRLLSAAYTPGSVFKLVTAAAAIERLDHIETNVYQCEGETIINGEKVTCPSAHGNVTLEQALAKSCNIAFAEISLELGGKSLQKFAEKAGFNQSMKVDYIQTAIGKANMADAEGGDLAWAGIGQYTDTANPLSFMAYVASIANNGVRVNPQIIKKDKGLRTILPDFARKKDRVLPEETAAELGKMMRNDVVEEYGEGNYKGLELCAKSGTAQVGADEEPHAWFVGYLDRKDCPLAFVVVVENGGSGSKVAGTVAGKVLKAAVNRLTEQ